MNRESSVVWFNNGIRDLEWGTEKGKERFSVSFQLPPVELSFRDRKTHLWRRHDRKSSHHTIWEFLTNLGDEERSHTSTSTTTKRVSDLETLKHVTPFGLLTDDVKDRVYELSTCGKKVQERDCMRLCVKTLKAECCSTFLRTASPSLPPTQKCDLSASFFPEFPNQSTHLQCNDP